MFTIKRWHRPHANLLISEYVGHMGSMFVTGISGRKDLCIPTWFELMEKLNIVLGLMCLNHGVSS